MKLHDTMPIIHFKPVFYEGKAKAKKGQNFYSCPTYMYPIRTGVRERPSYQFNVMLPCKPNPGGGQNEQDFWVKRGTALLMSLADWTKMCQFQGWIYYVFLKKPLSTTTIILNPLSLKKCGHKNT